jgi:hypothetical protein
VLVGADDLEVLVDEDLELLAVGGGDVGLVRRRGVAVGLGADDRRVRVLGEHGRLDLLLGLAGQRRLAATGPAVTPGAAVRRAAAAGALGLNRGGLEGGVDEDDLAGAVGRPDVGVVGRAVRPAGLGAQDRRARDLLERGGLDLRRGVAREGLALWPVLLPAVVVAGGGDGGSAEPEGSQGGDGDDGLADGGVGDHAA